MSDQNKGMESLLDPNSPLTKEPGAAFEAYMELWEAIERSGFAVSPCRICNQLVVCIPDGLSICRPCAEKAGG